MRLNPTRRQFTLAGLFVIVTAVGAALAQPVVVFGTFAIMFGTLLALACFMLFFFLPITMLLGKNSRDKLADQSARGSDEQVNRNGTEQRSV